MGSTNFQVFNPTQANQDTDAQYATDPQRVGGAIDGQPFPAKTANKFFTQTSVGITALMQMMATKGYVCNDSNLSTLASVLSAIQTSHDVKSGLQTLAYSSTINCNAALYNGFQVTLNGNANINITGASPGQQIAFVFIQGGGGNHTVSFPGDFYLPGQPDPTAGSSCLIMFQVLSDATGRIITPWMTTNGSFVGISGTEIGINNPAPGNFTSLVAAATALASLVVSGTTSLQVVTAAATTLASLIVSGAAILNGGTIGGTYAGSPTFTATVTIANLIVSTAVTLNGGTLNGNYAGNPNFTGTPTTTTPLGTDNSFRVANTAWAKLGFSISLGTNGFIKLPSFLGALVIQWGTTSSFNGTASFSFPVAFPTNCFAVVISAAQTGGSANFTGTISTSAAGFTAYNDGAGSPAMYIAIGN